MELVFGGKYRLGRKIGSGSFGDIYHGKCLSECTDDITITHITGVDSRTNIITTKEEVAIKLECVETRHPQLHIEAQVLQDAAVSWWLVCTVLTNYSMGSFSSNYHEQ